MGLHFEFIFADRPMVWIAEGFRALVSSCPALLMLTDLKP